MDSMIQELQGLGSRELEILNALNQDNGSTVTFQGLKRKLGMHQETLSRALNRLHRDGLIERTEEGYRKVRVSRAPTPDGTDYRIMPVLQSYLPPLIDLQSLVMSLRGSWFGTLRWLSYSDSGTETILTWITENGEAQIDLRVTENSMNIQARVKPSANTIDAVVAAHELYGHVSSLFTKHSARNAAAAVMRLENKQQHHYAS